MPLVLQPPPEQPREINQGRFAITYSNLSNSPLLEHEEWLLSTYLQIELYKNHPIFHIKECSTILLEDLTAALLEVENWKTLEWENQRIIAVQSSELRNFKHWLGRLLCRPGFESILDRDILDSDEGGKRECGDIVDTETIQSLQGPDGRNFLKAGIDEGRYVFGLCMDGFQPHGRGGPPCSVGAIYLACMNLPPNLRYKADNLFLAGIIP
ncbi:uncharacterized protein LAESUDRAFT_667623, partial [Laetiporus sulphureus 93-53]